MRSTGFVAPLCVEGAINGALFQRGDDSETTLTMSVDSIEDAISTITAEGGTVVQDKTPIPSMGWFATCRDPHGNEFGLWQTDSSAPTPSQ